jgi:hypothetical protein
MFAVRTVGGGDPQRRKVVDELAVDECGVPQRTHDRDKSQTLALEANPCLKIRPDVAARRAG